MVNVMSDEIRFRHLTNHFNSIRFSETFTIGRNDFNFLLLSHNKYLKLQLEHEALKREFKKNKRLEGIEEKLYKMGMRK